MIRNYIALFFRKLMRNKGFSIINISGLAIGMASAILILLWIQNEVGTDRFYTKTDRIYSIYCRFNSSGIVQVGDQTPYVLSPALKKDYPEVEEATRYNNITFLVSAGEKHLNLRGAFADSNFLSVFDFPLLKGNVSNALSGIHNIVLTEKLAKKLFGDEDAIGKTVRIDSNANFKVTAVLKDLPANTAFDFEYILPRSFFTKLGWDDFNWTNNYAYTYALLKPGTSQTVFDTKVKDIIINHTKGGPFESKTELFTQPLKNSYLYAEAKNGKLVTGRIEMVRLFAIIASFILLIACINFMNLSTARSEKYAKEVGIRKVCGAYRSSLIAQFIAESIGLSLITFIIAIILVQLSLPSFNQLIGKTLFIDYSNPAFWIYAVAFTLVTGIIAGSYPAIYLSSFMPVKVLKGAFKNVNSLITPRKALVVVQFTFAIILIISTIVVKYQIDYVQNRDAGYNKNNLVYTFAQGDADTHYQLIKQELISSGAAISVTRTGNPITQRWGSGSGYEWNGGTDAGTKLEFVQMGSDADFVKTAGLKLLQGRDIDVYNYPSDTMAVVLNESAVKAMHFKDPIGQIIRRKNYTEQWHVVGVVKDFILESPFVATVNPILIKGPSYFFQVIHFKLNPANSTSTNLAKAEKIFRRYNPQYPFEYYFADESYANKFREQIRIGSLAALFAGLTIFISCLGLFGLATYMAENRIKEIGVRKVLGASVTSITTLLSKDFLKLVIVSFIIASPIAWWAMSKWLETYSYRIGLEWWIFAGAGLLSVLIAVATVSYQSIKAAVANPVKSLRSE